jgi:cysteine synthase A
MSEGNSPARMRMLEALGARVVLVPQVTGSAGKVTGEDIEAAAAVARSKAVELKAFYVDQFHAPEGVAAHAEGTGPELWRQACGKIDGWVAGVGTGATFGGVAKALKARKPDIVCAAVEPAGSQPLAGKPVTEAEHVLQGTGYGAVPPRWDFSLCDLTLAVSDEEASDMRALLALREGLHVGFSAAANVCAALALLRSGRIASTGSVATVLCDTGLKY